MLFRLISLCAVFKNSSMSSRSFACSPLIFTGCRCFAILCRLQRWLMKWWTNGIAIPRWTSLPLFVSSSFAVIVSSESIVLIAVIHTLCLFSGRIINSCLKLINQPRIVFSLCVGLLTRAYCVPPLPLQELVCVDVVATRKCLLLAMVCGCIILNCLSLWFHPSEKLYCQCRYCLFL